jgi:hypothetical protein
MDNKLLIHVAAESIAFATLGVWIYKSNSNKDAKIKQLEDKIDVLEKMIAQHDELLRMILGAPPNRPKPQSVTPQPQPDENVKRPSVQTQPQAPKQTEEVKKVGDEEMVAHIAIAMSQVDDLLAKELSKMPQRKTKSNDIAKPSIEEIKDDRPDSIEIDCGEE